MKKRNFILSGLVIACTAICCAGIMYGNEFTAKAEEPAENFVVEEKTSLRIDGSSGIRFSTKINNAYYASLLEAHDGWAASICTMVIPTIVLGEQELTYGTTSYTYNGNSYTVLDVDQVYKDSKRSDETVSYYNTVVTSQPEDLYSMEMSVRSCVVFTKEGEANEVIYTNTQSGLSLAKTAKKVYDSPESSQAEKEACIPYLTKGISSVEISNESLGNTTELQVKTNTGYVLEKSFVAENFDVSVASENVLRYSNGNLVPVKTGKTMVTVTSKTNPDLTCNKEINVKDGIYFESVTGLTKRNPNVIDQSIMTDTDGAYLRISFNESEYWHQASFDAAVAEKPFDKIKLTYRFMWAVQAGTLCLCNGEYEMQDPFRYSLGATDFGAWVTEEIDLNRIYSTVSYIAFVCAPAGTAIDIRSIEFISHTFISSPSSDENVIDFSDAKYKNLSAVYDGDNSLVTGQAFDKDTETGFISVSTVLFGQNSTKGWMYLNFEKIEKPIKKLTIKFRNNMSVIPSFYIYYDQCSPTATGYSALTQTQSTTENGWTIVEYTINSGEASSIGGLSFNGTDWFKFIDIASITLS